MIEATLIESVCNNIMRNVNCIQEEVLSIVNNDDTGEVLYSLSEINEALREIKDGIYDITKDVKSLESDIDSLKKEAVYDITKDTNSLEREIDRLNKENNALYTIIIAMNRAFDDNAKLVKTESDKEVK